MADLTRDQWTWEKCNELNLEECQVLIIDYERKNVLLKQEEGRWTLPGYVEDMDEIESSYVSEYVKEKSCDIVGTSLDLYVLRQVWREEMDFDKSDDEMYVMEKEVVLVECIVEEGDLKVGNGYVWKPLGDADVYHLFERARKVVKEKMRMALEDSVPKNRRSWQRRGWLQETAKWMENALLCKLDARLVKPLKVERSTHLGTIAYMETTKGLFFLKCTAPGSNDAAYTEALSRIVPKYVAAPVVVDARRQVMITANYGQILRPIGFNDEDRVKLTKDYVAMQQETIGKTDELIRAGMPDFRLNVLSERIDWLSSHPTLDDLAKEMEFSEAVRFFRENLSKVKRQVDDLMKSAIPPTVNHNDTFLSNVYKPDGNENYIFFDFVDGYVAHPFTGETGDFRTAAYMQGWESYGTMESLERWRCIGSGIRLVISCILSVLDTEVMELPEWEESFKAAGKEPIGIHMWIRKVD